MASVRERWATPVNMTVDRIEERGHVLQIGEFRFEIPLYILTREDTERVRLGYVCIRCLEPHEQPYPERCLNCGFPIRDVQDVVFEKFYIGEVDIGPQTTVEEELEIATDLLRRKRYVAGSQILLPGRDFL